MLHLSFAVSSFDISPSWCCDTTKMCYYIFRQIFPFYSELRKDKIATCLHFPSAVFLSPPTFGGHVTSLKQGLSPLAHFRVGDERPWELDCFYDKVKLNNFDIFTDTPQNERHLQLQKLKWYHIIFILGEFHMYSVS